jgi:hypothetical protein
MHRQQEANKNNPDFRGVMQNKDGMEFSVYSDPHYGKRCVVCGQKPVVRIRRVDTDELEIDSDMCGPCTFGEAACLDPAEW